MLKMRLYALLFLAALPAVAANLIQADSSRAASDSAPDKPGRKTRAATASAPVPPTYYVDRLSGSDSNAGTSAAFPFASVAKINTLTLTPGQSVAFKAGQEWHETLTVTHSGAANLPITYTSYGVGPQPVLSAADNVTGWTRGGAGSEACASPGCFSSGFETTAMADWTNSLTSSNGTTFTLSTTTVNDGVHSVALYTPDGLDNRGYVIETLANPIVAGSSNALRFYVHLPMRMQPNSALRVVRFLDARNTPLGTISINTDASGNPGALLFYDHVDANALIVAPSLTGFIPGAWNEIDIVFTASATAGSGTLWVNNVPVATSTQSTNASGLGGATQIEVGNDSLGTGLSAGETAYFDDFKFVQSAANPLGPYAALPNFIWHRPQTTSPYLVNFSGQTGTQESSLDEVTGPNEFYWDGSSTLYIYSQQDPTLTAEVPQRPFTVVGSGSRFITLSNLTLQGARSADVYCNDTLNGCPNWTLSGNTIRGAYTNGVTMISSTKGLAGSFTANNNLFTGIGGSAISLDQQMSTAATIAYNEVANVCTTILYAPTTIGAYSNQDNQFCDGIKWYSDYNLGGQNTYVGYNYLHDIGVGLPKLFGGGIHADTAHGPETIEHNLIVNTNADGLQIEKGQGAILARYNLVVNGGTGQYGSGMSIRAGDGTSADGSTLDHNTVSGGWWAFAFKNQQNLGVVTATHITVSNNIFVNAASNTNLYDGDAGFNAKGNLFLNNDFGKANGNSYFLILGGTPYSGCSVLPVPVVGSLCVDPQFNNMTLDDFTLKPASPASGLGAFPVFQPALTPFLGPKP